MAVTSMLAETPVLEAVRALAPAISARSSEIERLGYLPPDLLADLTAAGCFRMQVPREFGGDELSPPEVAEVIEELSHADGSVGWVIMIGCQAPLFLAMLPRHRYEAIYAEGPDVFAGGAIAPKGVATPVEGGYRFSGQWPFASGSDHMRHVLLNCIVASDGGGPPDMRMACVDRDSVEFLDTWHVLGLRGTASTDVAADDVFVPEDSTFHPFLGVPCIDTPATRLPLRSVVGPQVATVGLGIARAALDEVRALAPVKRPAMNPRVRLAEDPVFAHRLGELDLRLRAARGLLFGEIAAAHETAVDRRPLEAEDRARLRAASGYVAQECAAIVDAAHTLAGSASVYDTSPLQRHLRDVHVYTQHQATVTDAFRILGALLAGEEVDLSAV